MNLLLVKIIGIYICICIGYQKVYTQVSSENLKLYLLQNAEKDYKEEQIKEFYKYTNYQPLWINAENLEITHNLYTLFSTAAALGLKTEDYPLVDLINIENKSIVLKNLKDSIIYEIKLTKGLLKFMNHLYSGNEKPAFGYDGQNFTPKCYNTAFLLSEIIKSNQLQIKYIQNAIKQMPEISLIEIWIKKLQTIKKEPQFKEVIIKDTKLKDNNQSLKMKLYQLGMIGSLNETLSDSALLNIIKKTKRLFNLEIDGKFNTGLLQALNVSIDNRISQLIVSINYYRWLSCLTQSINQPIVNVNIPSAYMKVYEGNNVKLAMKMIVGKKTTPTPTLSSRINEVILYPYWHVPYSIATKELLPAIKKNTNYLNKWNYQVLNTSGNIVDPYSINWHALSTGYFPYTIRQSTGCDNSLGLLKLDFFNPFGVYLHDTPVKSLFSKNRRFFSHGCMRMENPTELGHLVLKNNTIAIDTLIQKGCLMNKAPVIVHAEDHIPVIVWYNTVGIDANNELIFFEDIYKRF